MVAQAHTALLDARAMNVSPSFFKVPSLSQLSRSSQQAGPSALRRPHGLTPKAVTRAQASRERRRQREAARSGSDVSADSLSGVMGGGYGTLSDSEDGGDRRMNSVAGDGGDAEKGGADLSPPAKANEGTTGMLKSIFNLANTTVGAGTLAVPYFFSQAGLGLGCGVLFSIALVSCYSLHLLSRCRTCDAVMLQNDGVAASSYLDVAFFAFMHRGRIIVTLVMLCLCFGALVAYFVIIGTLSEQVIETVVGSSGVLMEWRDTLTAHHVDWLLKAKFLQILAMIFPIFPLGSLKNLSSLSIVSLLSLMAIAYLIGLVCQDGVRSVISGDVKTPAYILNGPALFFTIPSVGLAFTNQPNIYEIVDELKNPTPRRIACVSYSATLVCVILYLVVGVFGYLKFGDETRTNILLNYQDGLSPTETILFATGKVGMAMSMMVSYPLLLFPCRLCLHTLIQQAPGMVQHAMRSTCGCALPKYLQNLEVSGQVWFYGETISIICLTYLVSILVPNIVKVFGLTGALTGSFVVFIMPGAFALKLLPGRLCSTTKLPMWGLCIFGALFGIVSLVFITISMFTPTPASSGGGGVTNGTFA